LHLHLHGVSAEDMAAVISRHDIHTTAQPTERP
jgi:hypothetical protein